MFVRPLACNGRPMSLHGPQPASYSNNRYLISKLITNKSRLKFTEKITIIFYEINRKICYVQEITLV